MLSHSIPLTSRLRYSIQHRLLVVQIPQKILFIIFGKITVNIFLWRRRIKTAVETCGMVPWKTLEAAAPYLEAPGARRVRYHSYITTVGREGDLLVIADPLRKSGAIRYPPYFAEAHVPLRSDAGASPIGALQAGR